MVKNMIICFSLTLETSEEKEHVSDCISSI
jgi:hypothetical protein